MKRVFPQFVNFVKGSLIAEIPSCEREVREKAPWQPKFHCEKEKVHEKAP
jgi:hypothetical protein